MALARTMLANHHQGRVTVSSPMIIATAMSTAEAAATTATRISPTRPRIRTAAAYVQQQQDDDDAL